MCAWGRGVRVAFASLFCVVILDAVSPAFLAYFDGVGERGSAGRYAMLYRRVFFGAGLLQPDHRLWVYKQNLFGGVRRLRQLAGGGGIRWQARWFCGDFVRGLCGSRRCILLCWCSWIRLQRHRQHFRIVSRPATRKSFRRFT